MKKFFDKWLPRLWAALALLLITGGLIAAVLWVFKQLIGLLWGF